MCKKRRAHPLAVFLTHAFFPFHVSATTTPTSLNPSTTATPLLCNVLYSNTKREFVLGPGAAYVLSGAAQGTTEACQKHKQGHQSCRCCWTHGVMPVPDLVCDEEGREAVRQSITIRSFQREWGRAQN
mmetsp:Transcript_33002/g.67503  ORF Transcript_33002/g.67503 Transcript_33002/m.67503 type:complete len:128 (+) Transcript_33002:65-448(+)